MASQRDENADTVQNRHFPRCNFKAPGILRQILDFCGRYAEYEVPSQDMPRSPGD